MQNLIATALALIIGVFLLVTFANFESNKTQRRNLEVAVAGAASQMAQFSRATQQYVNANGASWASGTHQDISAQTLIDDGYLPSGWNDTNKFGQTVKGIGAVVDGTPTAMVYFDGQAKQVGGAAGNTGAAFDDAHTQVSIANRIAIAQLADYPQNDVVPGVLMAQGGFNGHGYNGRTGVGPYHSWEISLQAFVTSTSDTSDPLALVSYPGMRTSPPATCQPGSPNYPACRSGGNGNGDTKPDPPVITVDKFPSNCAPGKVEWHDPSANGAYYEIQGKRQGGSWGPHYSGSSEGPFPLDASYIYSFLRGRVQVNGQWSDWGAAVFYKSLDGLACG
jgi:hypothetical protein